MRCLRLQLAKKIHMGYLIGSLTQGIGYISDSLAEKPKQKAAGTCSPQAIPEGGATMKGPSCYPTQGQEVGAVPCVSQAPGFQLPKPSQHPANKAYRVRPLSIDGGGGSSGHCSWPYEEFTAPTCLQSSSSPEQTAWCLR